MNLRLENPFHPSEIDFDQDDQINKKETPACFQAGASMFGGGIGCLVFIFR
jgi:hypothetical protein